MAVRDNLSVGLSSRFQAIIEDIITARKPACVPCLARRVTWERIAARLSIGHRNPAGLECEVRARQTNGPAESGPHHPLRGLLSGELRLHPTNLRRGQRSARCAGPGPRAGAATVAN